MKSEQEIQNRIDELFKEIEEIDIKINTELNKPASYPDRTLLDVWNRNAAWKSVEISALQWTLKSE